MMNPPEGAQPGALFQQPNSFPNLTVSENEQNEIVALCRQFKQAAQTHAKEKKEQMRTCYAYKKGEFKQDNDLLPTPSSNGNERDANQKRPKIFIPITRQILNNLYSYIKLTIFSNDEDYFRVRSKDPEYTILEDELTEALKYKFKEGRITEKAGALIENMTWGGCFAAFPTINEQISFPWILQPGGIDPETGMQQPDYYACQRVEDPVPDLEAFNPINFYIDPKVTDPARAKWVYLSEKKLHDITDSGLYFNKDKLSSLASESVDETSKNNGLTLSEFNHLLATFDDTDQNIGYDLYYFPYLKTNAQEYRNMLVGVAADAVLVRFHPNLFPRGLNPVTFCSWRYEPENPYGQGPAEDIKELQRLVNILYNYMVELMARFGNRFAVKTGTDLSSFWGLTAGIVECENPGADIVPFHGDFGELAAIQNIIGVLKAEAQITGGSQDPFQGSSNIDFKKTATEIQVIQENMVSVTREIIEHATIMGIQPTFEKLMYLCADIYNEPISVPVQNKITGQTEFKTVDLTILKSGAFVMEMIGANPSQSKQAQVAGLTDLMKTLSTGPMMLQVFEPIIQKIGQLYGIKDITMILEDIKQRMSQIGPPAPPVPPPQGNVEPPQ